MPTYFFHVHDGRSLPDDQGTDLDDLDAAKAEAARFAGQMLLDSRNAFDELDDWRVVVADAAGMILFSLILIAVSAPSTIKAGVDMHLAH